MTATTPSDLFSRQHGLATDRQIRELGVSWERQRTMLSQGHWRRHSPGVLAVAGAPASWTQRSMAAVLGAGKTALLCGAAAARLHRLDGFATESQVAVLVPRKQRTRSVEAVDVRWSRRLSELDRHVINAIPVTTLPVTLIHLAASGRNVEKALDSALRQRFPPRWLSETFERWAGTPGATEVERLLADRIGQPLPRSWFQRLAKRVLESHGIELKDEWPVHDERGRLVAELDLAHVELKVGVECQSLESHGIASDRARDAQRARTLRRLGWEIVEVWWADLHRMDSVLADLELALRKAAILNRQPDVAPHATSG